MQVLRIISLLRAYPLCIRGQKSPLSAWGASKSFSKRNEAGPKAVQVIVFILIVRDSNVEALMANKPRSSKNIHESFSRLMTSSMYLYPLRHKVTWDPLRTQKKAQHPRLRENPPYEEARERGSCPYLILFGNLGL